MNKILIIIFMPVMFLIASSLVAASNCGGVTQCNCGDTLTSSQTMWYDIVNCGTRALTISTNNTILDCAGHMIDGTGSNYGIYAKFLSNLFDVKNITVRNCNIKEFNIGVYIYGATNNQVIWNNFSTNKYSMYMQFCSANLITNNMLGGSASYSVYFSSCGNNNITENNITNNTYGIYGNAGGNQIWNNSFTNNTYSAYELSGTNTWNLAVGNYWDDFIRNPGFPFYYEIPGPGSGQDNLPIWNLSGNTPPMINSTPILNATVGVLYQYDVEAYDFENNTITYLLDIYPAGMSINPSSGLINWTPIIDQVGLNPVSAVATDGLLNRSQNFSVNVTSTLPPQANCGGMVQCKCGDNLTLSQTMWYDLNNCTIDGLIITNNNVVLDCAGHTISGSGSNNGLLVNNMNGVSVVNCTINNFATAVDVNNSQHLDFNNNTVQLYTSRGILAEKSDGLILHNSTFNVSAVSPSTISFALVDSKNILIKNNNFTVGNIGRLKNVNYSNISNNYLSYGMSWGLQLYSSSSNNVLNGNDIYYSQTGSGSIYGVWLSLAFSNLFYNNTFKRNPVSVWESTDTSVNNSYNLSDQGNYWDDYNTNEGWPNYYQVYGLGGGIDYHPVWNYSSNSPPVINSNPVRNAYPAVLYQYDVNASDPDGNPITYNLSQYPAGMSINPATGLVSWTPSIDQLGSYPVAVIATDGLANANQSFSLTVKCNFTSSTVLNNDLRNCAQGVTVGANGITFDCAGHTIFGVTSGNGMILQGINTAQVKNCNILNFSQGFFVSGSSNIFSNNLINQSKTYGIRVQSGTGNSFSGNNLTQNAQNAYEESSGNSWSGNYWSDSLHNPGAPSSYEIPGPGNGVDWSPLHPQHACGGYLSEDTLLVNDLVNCAGDGTIIDNDNVILDCNNHLIDGQGTGTGIGGQSPYGIDNSFITVRNCFIQEFEQGLRIRPEQSNENITNNTFRSNTYWAINSGSSGNYINNSIYGGGSGIAISGYEGNVIAGNSFDSVNQAGLSIYGGRNNSVFNNTFINTGWQSIEIESSQWNQIINNSILSSNDVGMWVHDYSSNNTIEGNVILNSAYDGILINGYCKNNIISGNNLSSNDRMGIYLYNNSNDTIIEGNWLESNSWAGVYLYLSSSSNLITNNRFIRNAEGLHLDGMSGQNTIWNNTFIANDFNAYTGYSTLNRWNLNIGNYWDDFAQNSGYPSIYNIDGVLEIGVDYKPIWDFDNDGYMSSVDCNDSNAAVHPGVTEICNNVDDNCDAIIDSISRWCGTSNNGECRLGFEVCDSGIWGTCSGVVEPSTEVCDGKDNDCDGQVDEDCATGSPVFRKPIAETVD